MASNKNYEIPLLRNCPLRSQRQMSHTIKLFCDNKQLSRPSWKDYSLFTLTAGGVLVGNKTAILDEFLSSDSNADHALNNCPNNHLTYIVNSYNTYWASYSDNNLLTPIFSLSFKFDRTVARKITLIKWASIEKNMFGTRRQTPPARYARRHK